MNVPCLRKALGEAIDKIPCSRAAVGGRHVNEMNKRTSRQIFGRDQAVSESSSVDRASDLRKSWTDRRLYVNATLQAMSRKRPAAPDGASNNRHKVTCH